jgi:hypothetical protein
LVAVVALVAFASAAPAATVVYDATITIAWYNNYIGNRTNTDTAATVTVNYTGGGNFAITGVTYSSSVAGVGTMTLGAAGTTTGTIAAGTASGTMGYSGTLGSYTASNVNGPYSGTATGPGDTFASGDVYSLQQYWAGTTSFPLATNWDHTVPATQIIFGVPEPATLVLLASGVVFLRRRRA